MEGTRLMKIKLHNSLALQKSGNGFRLNYILVYLENNRGRYTIFDKNHTCNIAYFEKDSFIEGGLFGFRKNTSLKIWKKWFKTYSWEELDS